MRSCSFEPSKGLAIPNSSVTALSSTPRRKDQIIFISSDWDDTLVDTNTKLRAALKKYNGLNLSRQDFTDFKLEDIAALAGLNHEQIVFVVRQATRWPGELLDRNLARKLQTGVYPYAKFGVNTSTVTKDEKILWRLRKEGVFIDYLDHFQNSSAQKLSVMSDIHVDDDVSSVIKPRVVGKRYSLIAEQRWNEKFRRELEKSPYVEFSDPKDLGGVLTDKVYDLLRRRKQL